MGIFMAVMGFLKSPVGKYLLIGVLVVGVLLGLRSHFINQGHLEGKQEATEQFTSQHEKERAEDRAQLNQTLKQATDVINTAKEEVKSASLREQAKDVLINNLISQRNVAVAKVQGLQDSQLRQDIITKLALRASTDQTPGYTTVEEREIDVRVTGYPFYKDQSDQYDAKTKDIKDQVNGLQKQVDQLELKFSALANYTITVERDYTDLYNSFPRKGNAFLQIITFGAKGKPKKIPTPDPTTLFNNKPK
jgi:NAD(P)H-dependent FMN reductase